MVAVGVLVATLAGAAPPVERPPHHPHKPHPPRAPSGGGAIDDGPTNVHLTPSQEVALPGRGLALAWSPDGRALAVGGHFRERASGLRYDTRIFDVVRNALVRSFACHLYWVVATAWSDNPFVGPVVADGGGDHAVKVWEAGGPGSVTCKPGQARAADGALRVLPHIDGWITALAFSPDGRLLAGVGRDRTVRLWQLEPGPQQWAVVALWADPTAKGLLSVDWTPDGRALVTGDRHGQVTRWDFDPATDRWDPATIADFASVGHQQQAWWIASHPVETTRTAAWRDAGHGVVWHVRMAPDGTRVAATGGDGVLSVLDVGSGRPLLRIAAPRATALHGLDWSPDGLLLAAGAANHRIYVFDAATGARWDTLVGHDDVVTAVVWSPDGRTLASTAGGPLLSAATAAVSIGPDQRVQLWTPVP